MDVQAIFKTFHQLLNAGGYLAIADLYTEDGSFHEPGMQVHKGFNPDELAQQLNKLGFNAVQYQTCYTIERKNGNQYPVFLLTAQKNQ
jgi:hypothetical protein